MLSNVVLQSSISFLFVCFLLLFCPLPVSFQLCLFETLIGPHRLGLPQMAISTVCQPMEQRHQGWGILLQLTVAHNLGPHTMVLVLWGRKML